MILCARFYSHFLSSSHPLHFLFCSIYIYIVESKIATTFHRVTFQFYPHFAQPFSNPKKRAFFQRSSVTFQLTPLGRGKFFVYEIRGTLRVPCHTSSTRTDNFVAVHPCKAIESNQRRVKAAPKPFRDRVVPLRR